MSSEGDHNSGGGTKEGLDLGLSSLLASESSPPPSKLAPMIESKNDSEVPQSQSTFAILAQQSNWDELLRVSEDHLSSGATTEGRAWWVYAHLMRQSMPAAFLAAPFENLLIGNLSDTTPEVRGTLLNVAALLLSRLDAAGENGLAKVIREKLGAQGLVLEQSTGDGAAARGINTSHSEISLPSTFDGANREAPVKGELNEAAALAAFAGLKHLVTKAKIEAPNSMTFPVRGERRLQYGFLRSWKRVLLTVMVIIVCGTALYFKDFLMLYTTTQVNVASEGFMSTQQPVELISPDLKRRDMVGTLTALFYSIDATPTVPESTPLPSASVSVNGDVHTNIGSSVGESITAPALPTTEAGKVVPVGNKGPEKIRTDGPIEPESVRARLQGRGEQAPTNSNARRRDTVPSTAPPSRLDQNAQRGERSKDGIVMGIPERKPDSGVHYQVIARTMVVLEPSYNSAVVGRLLPGDIVIVEGRSGEWLKLRSAKGRPGYVLAQDIAGAPYEDYRR